MRKIFLEAVVASFGILIFGFVSIPVVAHFAGAMVSIDQGLVMSGIFFCLRVLWLALVRTIFSKWEAK